MWGIEDLGIMIIRNCMGFSGNVIERRNIENLTNNLEGRHVGNRDLFMGVF